MQTSDNLGINFVSVRFNYLAKQNLRLAIDFSFIKEVNSSFEWGVDCWENKKPWVFQGLVVYWFRS